MLPQSNIKYSAALSEAFRTNPDGEWNILCRYLCINDYVPLNYREKLANAIGNSVALNSIELNLVTDIGWICPALKKAKSLAKIKLAYMKLENFAQQLADALKQNSTVTTIRTQFIKINYDSTEALLDMLKYNSTVTKLKLMELDTKRTIGLWRDIYLRQQR
eukprot:TRINITY_DN9389_c0_g1_i1.p1 TRINITY_DN9389_c0_g1~~TRINITY_DN9389_c0_g1_i1.p1  ORF type:complete len:162 (+),score=0.11 TRINITY_DN9389_c0_g1_i1:147-632(+)